MKSIAVVLGMLLSVSVLFNVVAFVRLAEEPSAAAMPARGSAAPEAVRTSPPERPPEPRSAEEAVPAPGPLPAVPRPSAPAAPAPLRNDSKVREAIQANEAFNAFWKELDRVIKVRSKLDDATYAQTMNAATSDFLELGDPKRAQFEEAATAAAASYAAARREHDAARKSLPLPDRANPATFAAYQQQRKGIDARFDTQVKAAVDSLRPYLNAGDARHEEFIQSADKWLRNLAPRPTQP